MIGLRFNGSATGLSYCAFSRGTNSKEIAFAAVAKVAAIMRDFDKAMSSRKMDLKRWLLVEIPATRAEWGE